MTTLRERMLIRRLQQRDERAFAEVMRLYQHKVYNVVFRMVGNREEAEDVAQEVFVTVFKHVDTFRGDAKFSTWLYRIATNCWLAHVRKRHEEPLSDHDAERDGDDGDDPQLYGSGSGGGDHAPGATMKIDLERAMARLSEAERAAIVQCYHNDLSHEEAAYVLGWPVGTVKTHILRGKRKLKAALAAWAPSEAAR